MADFQFDEPENLGVFVCQNILEHGSAVLYVSHDEDGDWQFLCGGAHGDETGDGAKLVCLKEIVTRDGTLNQLADLCRLSHAERDEVGGEWRRHDGMEDIVRANVREHACHVMIVEADDEGPGFSYSIGLTTTYSQPELICFGLAQELTHWMINALRDRMAEGARFEDGQRVSGLIEGFDCVLRRMHRDRYGEYLGYALWFHDGTEFTTLQIVWPDKEHRFPWDDGYSVPEHLQPRTWQVTAE